MSKFGTHFVESEAILAAYEGDERYLNMILSTMTDFERRRLADACTRITLKVHMGASHDE